MIIGAEAVLCNSFVSYYFTVVEKVHYTLVLDSALALQRVLISYERYSCDSYLGGSPRRPCGLPCANANMTVIAETTNPIAETSSRNFIAPPDILARDRDGRDDQDDVVVHPTIAHRASK